MFEISSNEIGLLDLMFNSGLVKTKGDARRLIRQGAVKLDQEKINDEKFILKPQNDMILQSEKKRIHKN